MFAERILRAFRDATTVEEQANSLMNNLTNSHFMSAYQDLHRAIHKMVPNAYLHMFGSSITGLANVDSDLDIFVKVPEDEYPLYLILILAALRESRLFYKIFYVSNAKVPIIKCQHIETGVSCDLNLKSTLGVRNSQLLYVLLHSDDRIYFLAIIIKFWAKAHGLSGQSRFSNYALMMLLVFYLQQRPDAVLPSIASLQKNCRRKLISGWNVAFSDHWPQTTNTESLLELLHGFFKFCHEFDFAFRVICPLTGESYSSVHFSLVEELPSAFERYVTACRQGESLRLKPVTIQDPFELTYNIAACVSTKLLITFQELCEEMKLICESTPVGLGPNNLLGRLFVPLSPRERKSVSTTTVTLFPGQFADYALTYGSGVEMQEFWSRKVRSFVKLYIEKIMLFKIESWQEQPQCLSKPLSHMYYYVSYHIFYDYRRKVRRFLKFPDSYPFIEREIRLSEYIKSTYGFYSIPIMKITLLVRVCTKPCRLKLVITNNGTAPDKYCRLVQEFSHLQNSFNKYLDDLIKERRRFVNKNTPNSNKMSVVSNQTKENDCAEIENRKDTSLILEKVISVSKNTPNSNNKMPVVSNQTKENDCAEPESKKDKSLIFDTLIAVAVYGFIFYYALRYFSR